MMGRFAVARLAELDAGVPDGPDAVRLRAEAAIDPRAAEVLAALAATRAELAAWPVPPVPDGAERRWAAAVHAAGTEPTPLPPAAATPNQPTNLAAPSSPGLPPTAARPPAPVNPPPPNVGTTPIPIRRRAHPARTRSAVAAAALLVLLTALANGPDAGHRERIELAAAGRTALGRTDLGALADPARRAGCLRAARVRGLDPLAVPVGGRRVELARGPGVLLVYPTGRLGVFDVVVVDPGCGPAGGTLLGTARIGP